MRAALTKEQVDAFENGAERVLRNGESIVDGDVKKAMPELYLVRDSTFNGLTMSPKLRQETNLRCYILDLCDGVPSIDDMRVYYQERARRWQKFSRSSA